jgi:hypothetical protein
MIRRALRGPAAAALLVAAAAVAPACNEAPPPSAPKHAAQPAWQDVWDLTPELYVVVRPQAIKRDPVYGPLWKTVLRIAQAKSMLSGVTGAEVADGCEEIVAGMAAKDDAAIVFRGVPASLDAQRMVGPDGQPLFRAADERAKVLELTRTERGASEASVFVLPDRTWVAAIGLARQRARQAYATPAGRPVPRVDGSALAAIRIDAETFLVPRLGRSPAFGPLVKKLSSVTVALRPAKEGVVATLAYQDDDASAWAEAHAKRLVGELARAEGLGRLDFLKEARIEREGANLVVRVAIPQRLLDELPNVRGEEITW